MGFEGWEKIIDSLFDDVQEIVISGGEPQLHPDFVKICNYILSKDILCNVDTNLLHRKGLQINKSDNLVFYVSHHNEMTAHQENVWWKNMSDYKKAGYRIRCDYPNIEDKLTTKEEGYAQTFERFRPMYDPMGRLYGSFGALMKAQKYKG
jgi:organic radical activating enzyme